MTIYFDMDGTIADLYGVENWLEYLINGDPYPYAAAKPMVEIEEFRAALVKLKEKNIKIGIVSWLAKNSTKEYDKAVRKAKKEWLNSLFSDWDEIHIVKYGTKKSSVVKDKSGILIDDEKNNRDSWCGLSFAPSFINELLAD